MPVRSLRSSVLAWPGRQQVEGAVTAWARDLAGLMPGLAAVGFFGSYARGDWGVGSDVDLIVVIDSSSHSFGSRTVPNGSVRLPVPADNLIYTREEYMTLLQRGGRFADTLRREAIWVFTRHDLHGFPG